MMVQSESYRERRKQINKKYRETHHDILKKRRAKWYQKNKENEKQRTKKWRDDNPEWIKAHEKKSITFLGKHIRLSHNPRKGICYNCKKDVTKGEIKRTHLHHTKYDCNNPLAHTVELCLSCHRKAHFYSYQHHPEEEIIFMLTEAGISDVEEKK